MTNKTKIKHRTGTKKNNYKWKIGDIVKIPGGKITYIIKDELSNDSWFMKQYPEERYGDIIPKEVEKITGSGAWSREK